MSETWSLFCTLLSNAPNPWWGHYWSLFRASWSASDVNMQADVVDVSAEALRLDIFINRCPGHKNQLFNFSMLGDQSLMTNLGFLHIYYPLMWVAVSFYSYCPPLPEFIGAQTLMSLRIEKQWWGIRGRSLSLQLQKYVRFVYSTHMTKAITSSTWTNTYRTTAGPEQQEVPTVWMGACRECRESTGLGNEKLWLYSISTNLRWKVLQKLGMSTQSCSSSFPFCDKPLLFHRTYITATFTVDLPGALSKTWQIVRNIILDWMKCLRISCKL